MTEKIPSRIATRHIAYKRWAYTPNSDVAAWVSGENFRVTAGGETALLVSKDNGIVFKGPTAFTSLPHNILFGGMYKFNPATLSTIPSTIISPVPTFTLTLPMMGIAKVAKRMVSNLRSLLLG